MAADDVLGKREALHGRSQRIGDRRVDAEPLRLPVGQRTWQIDGAATTGFAVRPHPLPGRRTVLPTELLGSRGIEGFLRLQFTGGRRGLVQR